MCRLRLAPVPPWIPLDIAMDVLILSRLQFAFTIMFHYLFPPLTIGLSVVLVYLEGMYLWTNNPVVRDGDEVPRSISRPNWLGDGGLVPDAGGCAPDALGLARSGATAAEVWPVRSRPAQLADSWRHEPRGGGAGQALMLNWARHRSG